MAQNQSLAKGMGQQAGQGRGAQFNGAPGGAAGTQMTPEFLLALQSQQSQDQFRQQALQQASQAAQLARQQGSQAQSTHSQAALANMGLNAAAAAAAGKAGGRGASGNPGVAGFLPNNFPGGDLTRKFSQEQLNQQLNQISNMTNPQNTLALQGSLPGGVSGALPVGAAAGMSQAMSSRASAAQQMMRPNSLQAGHSMQSANPNSFARAAMVGSGMTVPEMTAMMAGTSQTANAEALRAAQQNAYGTFTNMGQQRPAVGQRMPNAPANASAADDAFWEKLECMKKKYAVALRRIAPITEIIADGQPPAKKDQFRKHLKDCFHILRLERSDNVSPRLTIQLLVKAERFIQSVIQVYQKLNASREKQQQAGMLRGSGGAAGSAQAAALQKQYAAQQGSGHVSPQNQMQFMNQLQQQQAQQQQMNQLPGPSAAMSAAAKAAKANANRTAAATRAAHGRVPRSQAPSAALMGGQPGMPVKPEQLASGLPYGLPAGAPGSEQEMAMLRHRQMLAAQQAQQHNQHLAQSFQHPSVAPAAARAKLQSQLAQAGQTLDPAALQMQQFQYMQARGAKRPPADVANPAAAAAAAKHSRAQPVDPLMAKQEAGRPVPTTAPAAPRRAPGATIDQKIQHMQSSVKLAVERAERLEQYVEKEMMRGKAERIQNTLAALRNASNAAPANGKKRGLRHTSLVDVENHTEAQDAIRAKTVFEASSENGLRLAKRPKSEAADIKSLKDAVEADCRSAQERNPLLSIEITEEFGQPVVTCQLLIEDIKLPKLILRVQRGYPRKGGATFGFERPPLGWVGVLDEIRTRFKRSLANAPATSVGVAAFLDAWAREAEEVIDANLRAHLKTGKVEKAEVGMVKAEPVKAK